MEKMSCCEIHAIAGLLFFGCIIIGRMAESILPKVYDGTTYERLKYYLEAIIIFIGWIIFIRMFESGLHRIESMFQ
jgi:hypothetical protein